jgi:hypothetical protein
MNKAMAWFFSLLAAAAALFLPRAAHAFCGFYVAGADRQLYNHATQVVLMRDGTRTVLSMQNNYDGPPEGFALVVPVPVVLQKENVKTLPRDVFAHVDQLGSPRLVEYWEQDPCAPGGLGLVGMGAGGGGRGAAMPMAAKQANLGVTVEAQFTVGEYEIVILSATDSAGLATWLGENKYRIPDGAEPYLRPYVAGGSKFFVAKVDPTKVHFENGQAMLSPLRFHYDSDRFELPIRLGLINAKDSQDLIVSILAKNQRYQVANYENVTIPTNLDVADDTKTKFGSFYAALFDETVAQHPRAVVTEYSWDSSTCDPCPGPALSPQELATLGLDVLPSTAPADAGAGGPAPGRGPRPLFVPRMGGGFVLTRLHARYAKDSLGNDLVFSAAPPIAGGREFLTSDGAREKGAVSSSLNNFQARYAIRHAWTGAVACESPRRGVWGGPPAGTPTPQPQPATNLAFAPRGGIALASYVREDVPELGIRAASPEERIAAVPPQAGAQPAPPAAPPPSPSAQPSCLGCRVGAPVPGAWSALGFVAIAMLSLYRRRRRG